MLLYGKYHLEADYHNFILLYDTGKHLKHIGYYSSVQGVIRAMIRHIQKMDIKNGTDSTDEKTYLSSWDEKAREFEEIIASSVQAVERITPEALLAYNNSKKSKKTENAAVEEI